MHRNAYLLLVLTALFWGANAVAGKLAVGHVSPMLLTTLRWGLAMAILFAIGRVRLKNDWPVVRRHLWLLIALGGLGFTVFNMALYTALIHTTAINASIEQAGTPMVIFAANFLLFRLRVTWAQIAGFLLSMAGVILTATHGEPLGLLGLELNIGDALMLVAVLVYAVYTVMLRLKPAIHWQSLMIMLTGAAFVTSIPALVVEHWSGSMIVPDAQGWGIVLFTVVFPSVLAQAFYIRGVELIGANRAGLFFNLVPIFGLLLSIAIIGEDFHPYHAMAMVLVLGGIWLAEHSGRKAAG